MQMARGDCKYISRIFRSSILFTNALDVTFKRQIVSLLKELKSSPVDEQFFFGMRFMYMSCTGMNKSDYFISEEAIV